MGTHYFCKNLLIKVKLGYYTYFTVLLGNLAIKVCVVLGCYRSSPSKSKTICRVRPHAEANQIQSVNQVKV